MALVAVIAGGIGVALVPAYIQAKEEQGLVGPPAVSSASSSRGSASLGLPWLVTLWVFADEIVA